MKTYANFYLKRDLFFKEGTLLYLENTPATEGYFLPDSGGGQPAFIPEDDLLAAPDFDENVPPSRCPTTITSVNIKCINPNEDPIKDHYFPLMPSDVRIEHTFREQLICIALPNNYPVPQNIVFRDTLRDFEDNNTAYIPKKTINGIDEIHWTIAHNNPGFYEMVIQFDKGIYVQILLIKFFPEFFEGQYVALKAKGAKLQALLPLRNAQIKQYTLLNDAFELATEWGENFAKPIHERMLKKHPELSVSDIDTLVKTAKDAESAIYRLCEEEEAGKIHEAEIFSTVSNQYIWLNPQHARRLIGIGMYYARR